MRKPSEKPATPAEQARREREARLAAALRANLRRRKANPAPGDADAGDDADG